MANGISCCCGTDAKASCGAGTGLCGSTTGSVLINACHGAAFSGWQYVNRIGIIHMPTRHADVRTRNTAVRRHSRGAAFVKTHKNRGAAYALVTTGMMNPRNGGSVSQVASDHFAPTAGCQPLQGAKPATAGIHLACSLVGPRAIEWVPRVAVDARQTISVVPRVLQE